MATVTTPDKYWGNLFEQATKDISLFQQAVFEYSNSIEDSPLDCLLIRIFANLERGRLTMDMINRPDLPEAYHSDRSRLTHVWIEAENIFFHQLETDKNSKADITTLESVESQNIDHCPDPGMLISFALNELENDQASHIKEHIDTCFLCHDLVFDTVMAEYEALQKQGEALVISDRFLSAISPDPASAFYKRLLHLVIVVNAHIKNRARNQSFQQKGFVFATASSDEEPLKGIDEIPFELNITPRDGLLQIPCIGDAGEGKTFIEDILKREYFYTHVFVWDTAKNRIDWGIKRHERRARAISVVDYSDILVVVGQDKAAVESAARYIPLWLEDEDFRIESEFNASVILLWYRIVKED